MDIRNWPMDRIMQLPDCCFGRKWPIACEVEGPTIGAVFDISEVAFPEKCVLWQLSFETFNEDTVIHASRLAIGDQLPTTAAMMDALEPLFYGLGAQGAEPRTIGVRPGNEFMSIDIRQPLNAMGRRLVLQVTSGLAKVTWVRVVVVVSSMPTEVPDWLLSEYHRSR